MPERPASSVLPERVDADADGRDDTETRDDDSLAHTRAGSPEITPHLLR